MRAAREVAVAVEGLAGRWAEPPMVLAHSWLGAENFLPRLADWMTCRTSQFEVICS